MSRKNKIGIREEDLDSHPNDKNKNLLNEKKERKLVAIAVLLLDVQNYILLNNCFVKQTEN